MTALELAQEYKRTHPDDPIADMALELASDPIIKDVKLIKEKRQGE